jgi:uncharacterized protein YhaN
MRINQLNLIRYGIFTQRSITFPLPPAGQPDLHIVYGPNEAGKSTALSAFLDLLFGIETRSPYGFLHPYATMRIGAQMEVNGVTRTFFRIKKPQNSLLTDGDKPIPDSVILGELGGVDRATYATMFSLDDDTLEAGGESILASKGDLGQLLFSASAGLSDLAQKLADLRAEADAFYKYKGRNTELAELKTRLADLKKQRDEIDTAASEYARLVEEHDRLDRQYDEAHSERGRTLARRDEHRRHISALPRVIALHSLQDRIAPISEIPEAPSNWAGRLPDLQKSDIELETKAAGLDADVSRLAQEFEAVVVDDRVLNLADRITLLADLHARYVTADKDVPKLQLQLREVATEIASIVRRVDATPGTEPGVLLLGTAITSGLRDLMEKRSGIDKYLAATEEELATAGDRLAAAKAKLTGQEGEPPSGNSSSSTELASIVASARADDWTTRRRLAERRRGERGGTLAEEIRKLRPWTGEALVLRDLATPNSDDIARWKTAMDSAEKKIGRYSEEVERLAADERRLSAEIEAATNAASVLNDQQAAEIRTAREDAWANHKRTLDLASAEIFEGRLRRDDITTGSRIANAAEVAHLNETTKALAGVRADLTVARRSKEEAAEALQGVQNEVATAIRAVSSSLPDDWSLARLEAWLERRDAAIETIGELETAERDLREAEQDGDNIRLRLLDAAKQVDVEIAPGASTESILSLLQAVIDSETKLNALRQDIADRKQDVVAREREAKKAKAADQEWQDAWTTLCGECWLGFERPAPPVSATREILKVLDELAPLAVKRASLSDRIEKMEGDRRRFAGEVEALAALLHIQAAPALDLSSQIATLLENARSAKKAKEEARGRLEGAKTRRRSVAEAVELHNVHKAEMTTFFGVGSLDEVDAKLRGLKERKDLQQQIIAQEQEILVATGAPSIADAEQMLQQMDRSAAEAEVAQLDGRFADQDRRVSELFSQRQIVRDGIDAVGGDNAVARLDEQRRTTLLEIEQGAKRYLRLRLGIAATEHALRIYRDEHRSIMLARASEAFRTISQGAYKTLTTQPDKDGEVLVAVGANGGSKIAPELSKGTRFQLYLALRVAGYEEFVRMGSPIPFIADDILETFDDFRAEEALTLLAEMAKVGQVIYLTHHRHLCDIAAHACPGVQIHSLTHDASDITAETVLA